MFGLAENPNQELGFGCTRQPAPPSTALHAPRVLSYLIEFLLIRIGTSDRREGVLNHSSLDVPCIQHLWGVVDAT